MIYSFKSMGAGRIVCLVYQGRGPYNYKIGGQNHHLIGNLLPNDGASPKFSQLYIYMTLRRKLIKNRKNVAWYYTLLTSLLSLIRFNSYVL